MMKDTKTEKNKLRRYLDDMYIREEASQLLESMRDADHKDILDELSAEVWEESVSQQPVTDLEREKYKKEARQLLKHIEHKKRTWFRRVMTIAASVAAVIAIVTGSISYFRYMSEQQITFAEISTSFGEKKRVELPDGTILVLNSCSQVRYPDSFQGDIRKVELEVEKPDAPIPLRFDSVSVKTERGWHRVFIALGSNMGERLKFLERAVADLRADVCFRDIRVSDYIETAPYGGVEQDDFLNGVLEAETLYSPEGLLARLQEEERLAERKREIHWGPRTLDLDILFYDDLVLAKKELSIPHPDMKNRQFVLEPLSELAPFYVHPVYRKTVKEMLEELEETGRA